MSAHVRHAEVEPLRDVGGVVVCFENQVVFVRTGLHGATQVPALKPAFKYQSFVSWTTQAVVGLEPVVELVLSPAAGWLWGVVIAE